MGYQETLQRYNEALWEIPASGEMRVPVRICATEDMLDGIFADNAPVQAVNVAALPGIRNASLVMPDIHYGYGFPIGGVAAFNLDEGVVSPGGVGYDINCGVRVMVSNLTREQVEPVIDKLLDNIYSSVPSGVGSGGEVNVSGRRLDDVLVHGAQWAQENGYGTRTDVERIEDEGKIENAAPSKVSKRARERGGNQLGTLGSGNHFLEVGCVKEIYDAEAAETLGLFENAVTATVHCGSRGLGHQVCDDSLQLMDKAASKHDVKLPDRQLACAPVNSSEGQKYLETMRCAVNFGFANRQVIASRVREAFGKTCKKISSTARLDTVYEVTHNIAKLEKHVIDGEEKQFCVHRKGATRAFPPGHQKVTSAYRNIGQPVLIPGDMGSSSYILVGTQKAMEETFGSACHGAGRVMSRKKAKKAAQSRNITDELSRKGIRIRCRNKKTLAEEMSDAYKDAAQVVNACVNAGITKRVARIEPLGCVKG